MNMTDRTGPNQEDLDSLPAPSKPVFPVAEAAIGARCQIPGPVDVLSTGGQPRFASPRSENAQHALVADKPMHPDRAEEATA
jgi:hypothetical protein